MEKTLCSGNFKINYLHYQYVMQNQAEVKFKAMVNDEQGGI